MNERIGLGHFVRHYQTKKMRNRRTTNSSKGQYLQIYGISGKQKSSIIEPGNHEFHSAQVPAAEGAYGSVDYSNSYSPVF